MDDFIHTASFLSFVEQREVLDTIKGIRPGFYQPVLKSGGKMSIKMNCLGWHWSAVDYKYHKVRSEIDGKEAAPIPARFQELAKRALLDSEYLTESEYRPFDVCIINYYADKSKLGIHVDNSETSEALESGYPVVSFSIGASCIFQMGGLNRKDPMQDVLLGSGDLVIFGRSKRLAYHGVKKVLEGTDPEGLIPGRFNLTFRIL